MKKGVIFGAIGAVVVLAVIAVLVILPSMKINKEWKEATTKNTISAYESFMKNHEGKKVDELDDAIFQIMEDNKEIRQIGYQGFRLRKSADVSSSLVLSMSKGIEVTVLKESNNNDIITIDGFSANTNWSKIELDDGTVGWVYNAGLFATDEFFEAFNFYNEEFKHGKHKSDVEDLYEICDNNVWDETKKLDTQEAYNDYVNDFSFGNYIDDAEFLYKILDYGVCYERYGDDLYETYSLFFDDEEVSGENIGDYGDSFSYNIKGTRTGKTLEISLIDEYYDDEEFSATIVLGSEEMTEDIDDNVHYFQLIDCDEVDYGEDL